ncbi:MAG: TetR/AcrR family transcriptional regulator [Parachlamydiales bacterium]|nr:TetR/AcrR family transcriptional regulator [Parachlamydiales bacterium]
MKRIVKNPADRKAEIIQAAKKLFLLKEYESTTMQDVMDTLGIAKGTIYHYFDSKEDLFEAVVIDMVDGHLVEIEAKLQKIKGNALQKIEKLIELSNMAQEHPKLLDQLHRPVNAGMHIRILVETLIKLTPAYEKLIQQGCEEGIFHTEHPKECAELILSAIQFLTDTGIYPWPKKDLERRMNAFPNLIEQQLKAAPFSFAFLRKLHSRS